MPPDYSIIYRQKRVDDVGLGRLKMPDIAGHDAEVMFEGGGRYHQVCTVMPQFAAQPSPAAGNCYGQGQDALPIADQDCFQPTSQTLGKVEVMRLLPRDAPFNLADGHDTEVELGRAVVTKPLFQVRVALLAAGAPRGYPYPSSKASGKVPGRDRHTFKIDIVHRQVEQVIRKRRQLLGFQLLEFFKFLHGNDPGG